MRDFNRFSAIALILAIAAASSPTRAADRDTEPVDFARQILPVLSDKCFVCHGPDAKDKDQLRLDSFAAATASRDGRRAINTDAPQSSELLLRIHDADDPMPPRDSDKKLSPQERDLLSRWVRQGGQYADHWAFVPPRKVRPGGKDIATEAAIDTLVQARLREKGIDFAAPAHRATLARRAALVLTGLPPEPAQLAAFLADKDDGAYERFVETMLASPRYGEHQARYWLDAVRYGDTHGLHLDNRRGIYPYRDWVVHAFNNNLPLDDFLTWQIAGDLLPDPTIAQRVATGFVRMNPSTAEGGVIPAEFQAKNNFDRTETLGTVLLGMTLNCARCHSHKYDPIPQEEYYRLLAFFNSTAEGPLDGNKYIYGPVVKAPPNQAAWNEWSGFENQQAELLAAADIATKDAMTAAVKHAKALKPWKASDWSASKPLPADAPLPEEKELTKVKQLPGAWSGNLLKSGQAVWVSFNVTVATDQVLWLTYSGGPRSQVMVDGTAIATSQDESPDQRRACIPLALSAGTHKIHLKMTGPKIATTVEARLHNPWQALATGKGWNACSAEDCLFMLADPRGPFAQLPQQPHALAMTRRATMASLDFTTTLIAKDLPKPRPTRVLQRGEYNLPAGDPLEPGILTVMGAFPNDAPRNRLGLARWLTAPEHPLVARVTVNQIWLRTFGEGLVRTPEDFGLQGQQPTHPLLLDWLAVELHDSDWDMKHMLRLMVTSRAFRQRSARRDDVNDPENRLLARGPSHRLDAEVIRDVALWASGLLDPQMGGEGVKPYQPGGMWAAMAHPASNTKRYVQDKGPKLYRRSLYVYWKRTSPHPMMTLFDAPSREASCVRRSRTNTSLQSLGLLNETQRLEMSRMLAQRLLREVDDDDARLDMLFNMLACRKPAARERAACTKLLQTMRKRYAKAEKDALALLAAGDAPRDPMLDVAEHAAWAQVVITVLASDVAILLY